jgi:hypothetical protein
MISKDKTYRTRDGREVRIYATDGDDWSPVHGAIKTSEGWRARVWREDGIYLGNELEPNLDLIEVKPRIKRTVWLQVFRDGEIVATSEPPAHYLTTRFACVKVEIDCEEGEGL